MAELKNSDNAHAYGDLDSEVLLAPKGTTLPQTVTAALTLFDAPPAVWGAVGWLSEDGVDLALSVESKDFKAFQGGTTIKTKVTSTDRSLKFQALEEKPLVTQLFWGHGDVEQVAGGSRYELPESVGTVERCGVVRLTDGDVEKFYCFTNLQVSERGTLAHKLADLTVFEFTSKIIGSAYCLTTNPAYAGA